MKCPVCKEVNLVMSERQGIEIDYCPECRGVWLDRGELDKIITKTESQINLEDKSIKTNEYGNNKEYSKYNKKENHGHYNNQKGRKKESFISSVFDMFGD